MPRSRGMKDWGVTSYMENTSVKNRLALSAAVVAGLLSLAACAPDPISASPSASADPSAVATVPATDVAEALAAVEWTDNGEATPTITFDTPVNYSEYGSLVVEDGDGAEITADSIVTVHYAAINSNDASVLYSTWDDGLTQAIPVNETSVEASLLEALTSAHVGAKILFAVPDLDGSGATLMALVVQGVTEVLDRAEGTAVDPVAGLPVITLADNGAPSVSFDGATMSTELVAQDLITGAGDVVAEGDSLTVHYTGWIWNGEQFDSSWDTGSPATFTLATGQLIDGWVQGLVGKTVGSQVLLVIPPALGYGAEGSGTIPGDSTLVFVVDILAAS